MKFGMVVLQINIDHWRSIFLTWRHTFNMTAMTSLQRTFHQSLVTCRDMWMNSGCLWCSGSQSERRRRSSAAARSRSDASDTARHHVDAPRRSSDCTDDVDSMSGNHVPLRDNIYDRRADDLDHYNYKVCHPESWSFIIYRGRPKLNFVMKTAQVNIEEANKITVTSVKQIQKWNVTPTAASPASSNFKQFMHFINRAS